MREHCALGKARNFNTDNDLRPIIVIENNRLVKSNKCVFHARRHTGTTITFGVEDQLTGPGHNFLPSDICAAILVVHNAWATGLIARAIDLNKLNDEIAITNTLFVGIIGEPHLDRARAIWSEIARQINLLAFALGTISRDRKGSHILAINDDLSVGRPQIVIAADLNGYCAFTIRRSTATLHTICNTRYRDRQTFYCC